MRLRTMRVIPTNMNVMFLAILKLGAINLRKAPHYGGRRGSVLLSASLEFSGINNP